MAVRPLGTGYDPNSGQPPDDSTSIPWDSDVDLSGYGNFGPGGFAPNPKLTAPATGTPPGMSLSGPGISDSLTARPAPVANPYGAGMPRGTGPQFSGPQNPPLRNPPAVRNGPGPYTDVTPNADGGGFTPSLWGAAAKALPYASGVLGPLGAYFGSTTPAETGELPRQTLGRRPSGPAAPTPSGIGSDANRPLLGAGGFPTTYGLPGQQPPALGGAPSGIVGSPAPAMPPPRPVAPVAAGPAAAQQQPNLGNYAPIYQPNIARTGNVRGGRSGDANAPMMGALDLSRLFQRPQQ